MPNNFKLRGDYYVSKFGNDSWDGLTPDTPKRTVQAGFLLIASSTKRLIIGAGVYNETVAFIFNSNIDNNIIADGDVIIDGTGNKTLSFRQFATGTNSFTNITFRSFQNVNIEGFISPFNRQHNYIFTNCKFLGPNMVIATYQTGGSIRSNYINCIFIGVTNTISVGSISNYFSDFNSCILINYNQTSRGSSLLNCYLGIGSIFQCFAGMSAASMNFNNIQGVIIINDASTATSGVIQDTYGRYYDLSIAGSGGSGTISNPYRRSDTSGKGFYFPAHRIAYPTYNANSFSTDPGFNNILKQDFSLQSGSFMVGRASNYLNNIGGTFVATRLDASGSTFSGSNAAVDALVFAAFSDYVISGSAVTGSVQSAPIYISSSAKVIQEIDYNGLLNFNKDTTAPSGSNINVPDVITYTSASNQPGANPDRLTYYMRWTTGSSQPVTEAQWDNGGLWPTGSFNVFEWNAKPSVDYLGRGNGDQNFNLVNTPTYVKATWIQLKLTLRNDYLI